MVRRCVIYFISLSFAACNLTENKKFEFYYYPSRNIYYDVANAQFVYSINGGKTWDVYKIDFTKDPSTLGAKQVFYSDAPQPWTNNAEQLKQFNGKVYNIPVEDTTMQTDIVSNKKIIKKAKPVDTIQTEEKKPGFFKRLFGRKKKN